MTATAYKLHRMHIKESLGLHNCFELVANFDRKNIFYEKAFRYKHWYWCLGGHLQTNLCCSVCKTQWQCLCVECSFDMKREWFYLIRQIFLGLCLWNILDFVPNEYTINHKCEFYWTQFLLKWAQVALSHIYVIICIYKLNLLGQYKNPYSSARTKF
jgi:hypothetical protein